MRLNTTEKIKEELRGLDSELAVLIDTYGDVEITAQDDYFETLASSIVGQQLSNKVADIIWGRLVALFEEEKGSTPNSIKAFSGSGQGLANKVTAEALMDASVESLRAIGLSNNKIAYLKNFSEAVISGSLQLDSFQDLGDEEIIAQLTKIKGIGRWTAEMFLIFSLGRQDVFSLGDGGLYNAIKKLYNLENPTKQQVLELTKRWSPYRTLASLYLWKSLDNGV